jgi:DNA (cytosine-5)-methyltransferase 1
MLIKVLNLYAGIGGNRKLWGNNIKVVAVEIVPEIAAIYKKFFPNDEVIIADAHKYLLEHFREFDFIWSSPPYPSHSRVRINTSVYGNVKPLFPDMKLYEEIIFLQTYFKGKFCIENVISYYEPLIKPKVINKHYFWSNFNIPLIPVKSREHNSGVKVLEKVKGFNLDNFKGIDKEKVLRNCVEPLTALHIFECAFIKKQKEVFDL